MVAAKKLTYLGGWGVGPATASGGRHTRCGTSGGHSWVYMMESLTEEVYQEARKIVIAEMQVMCAVLGRSTIACNRKLQ